MITVRTAAERPDLWKVSNEEPGVWPEYNLHGDVLNQWWGLLDEELPPSSSSCCTTMRPVRQLPGA